MKTSAIAALSSFVTSENVAKPEIVDATRKDVMRMGISMQNKCMFTRKQTSCPYREVVAPRQVWNQNSRLDVVTTFAPILELNQFWSARATTGEL
jgi:hypothetical protein